MKKSLLIFILVFSLFLTACGKAPESRDSVSIWCLEDEAILPELKKAAEKYNKNVKGDYLPVSIRTFTDFDAMTQGFSALLPDLIVCTQAKAEELNSMGLCRDIGSLFIGREIPFPDYIRKRSAQNGRSYFPVGGDIPLLCGSDEQSFDNFKELSGAAQEQGDKSGLPFLSLQRLPELFYYEMLSAGKEFHAVREKDLKSPLYKEIYNFIADGLFSGGITTEDKNAVELVKKGLLPYAGVFGSALQATDVSELHISLMPSMNSQGEIYAASSGFAVCIRDGREQKSTAQFLSWMFSEERAGRLSIKSGLVPFMDADRLHGENPFEQLLINIGAEKELHLPEFDSDFVQNQNIFDEDFKAQMANVTP